MVSCCALGHSLALLASSLSHSILSSRSLMVCIPQNSRVLSDLLKGQVSSSMPKVAVTVTQKAEAGRSVV